MPSADDEDDDDCSAGGQGDETRAGTPSGAAVGIVGSMSTNNNSSAPGQGVAFAGADSADERDGEQETEAEEDVTAPGGRVRAQSDEQVIQGNNSNNTSDQALPSKGKGSRAAANANAVATSVSVRGSSKEILDKDKNAANNSLKKPKRISAFSSNPAATAAAGTATAAAGTATAAPTTTAASANAAAVTSSQPSTTSAKISRSASKLTSSGEGSLVTGGAGTSSSKSSSLNAADFKLTKSNKEGARCYYLGKTNGWKLVRDAMDKRGWTMMPSEYHFSTRYGFKWVERRNQIDYVAHIPGQLVCHFPNNDCITTKIGMLCTLRDKFCKQAPGSTGKLHPPWLPHTYDLESPADCIALIQEEERLASGAASSRVRPPKSPVANTSTVAASAGAESDALVPEAQLLAQQEDDEDERAGKVGSDITGGIWIYKPSCTNRGRGIKVITGLPALKELCYGKPMGSHGTDSDAATTLPYKGIVQKYIRNPLLVTKEGYKFDVRCYLLVARNFPTTLAFYHPGYCRLALKPYSVATAASLEDNCVHLTNAAIQKKDAIYLEEGNKELQVLNNFLFFLPCHHSNFQLQLILY